MCLWEFDNHFRIEYPRGGGGKNIEMEEGFIKWRELFDQIIPFLIIMFIYKCIFPFRFTIMSKARRYITDKDLAVVLKSDYSFHLINNKKELEILLNDDTADINAEDNNGWTLLEHLISKGRTSLVEILLRRHDIEINRHVGDPLRIAVRNNRKNITEMLLNYKGIDVNAGMVSCRFTAFQMSIFHSNREIAVMLIAHGAGVECLNYNCFGDSKETLLLKKNLRLEWKQHLPPWNRFITVKRYPKEFNFDIAFTWLLCCKQIMPKLPKDIQFLIIEWMARVWKNEIP